MPFSPSNYPNYLYTPPLMLMSLNVQFAILLDRDRGHMCMFLVPKLDLLIV